MKTIVRVFVLASLLGSVVIGIILVGQKQIVNKQAAEISTSLLNLRPTQAPSPTPSADAGSVIFTVRFQGANSSGASKKLTLLLKQGEQDIYLVRDITVTSALGGVFSGRVESINPGEYDFYIKGEAHLVRKFPAIVVKPGDNRLDFSSKELMVGDLDGNNRLNVNDIGILSSKIIDPPLSATEQNSIFDLNSDGGISSADMDLILSNYNELEAFGE